MKDDQISAYKWLQVCLFSCLSAASGSLCAQQISFPGTDSSHPSTSFACQQATRSYDIEAKSGKQNEAAIEMKRSAMYIACGVREPEKVDIRIDNRHQRYFR